MDWLLRFFRRCHERLFARRQRQKEVGVELDELKLKLSEDREGFEREFQNIRGRPPASVPPPPGYIPTVTELILQDKTADEIDRLLLEGRARRDD